MVVSFSDAIQLGHKYGQQQWEGENDYSPTAAGTGSYPPHFFMFHLSNCYDHLCNTDSIIFTALESSCVCWRENHTTGSQWSEAMKSQWQWISSGRHLNGDPYSSYHSDHCHWYHTVTTKATVMKHSEGITEAVAFPTTTSRHCIFLLLFVMTS